MGYSRPRGGSLPLPMDATLHATSGRRTIATHLEGVVLDDMDALVSVHAKAPSSRASHARPPPPPPPSDSGPQAAYPRRGSTSNCFSRRNPRRRRRSSSNPTRPKETSASDEAEDDAASETTFFVDDEPVPALANSVVRVLATDEEQPISLSDRGAAAASRRPYGTPNRPHRSTSMPTTRASHTPNYAPAEAPSRASQRRHTHQPATATATAAATAKEEKRRRHVQFTNAYEPTIVPDTRPAVQSYDELLFNVAGLYHTLSYLHDADYFDDGTATDSSSSSSDSASHDAPPPPERSMQLMIAEFLYRSAVYLGYPPDDNVWVPGFREKKKFSSNDVKRWRRLALFDWAAEERAFAQDEAERQALSRASSRTSSRWTTRMTSNRMTTIGGSSRGSSRETSTFGLRATVSNWLHLGRGSTREHRAGTTSAALVPLQSVPHKERPLPTLVLEPPLVPSDTDLSLLVEVANSCVSYGAIRFTERQIRKLCNVPIRK